MASSAERRLYDDLGRAYARARRTDPRIAAVIWSRLGDAGSVLNVGAGTGSYEPSGREVVAVEPSATMRAQRPPNAAPCVAAVAEELPFEDASFDVAMSLFSHWHWTDEARGFAELRRVARRRALVVALDRSVADEFWLVREYLPHGHDLWGAFESTVERFEPDEMVPIPIPADCVDGFFHAYWRRPHAYLDPLVREPMAVFKLLDAAEIRDGLGRLADDLRARRWHARHGRLLERDEIDLGYRLLVRERGGP
jgi:SAM-dependent methyltransferase